MAEKCALVTGGVGGIGTSICAALVRDGYRVVASYAPFEAQVIGDWQKERQSEGLNIDVVEMDVTNFDSCGKAIADVESRVGPIAILVNNAGITKDGMFKKMALDQWNAVLTTNLDSVFNVTRHVINGMLERSYGRIINISSINGQKGQFGQTNYSAAKAGMHGFTMALAQEVASKGITVNTVSPGYTGTRMVMAIEESVRNKIVEQIPVKRLARPEEIARLIAFLAHEDSGFITGANVPINGGQFMG
ncbi:MAG: acetoacetyl-CoA reductase [Magnetococcales bacterium]|nr:acetoacetyl-CoA reductase [Magnetococcales bacterium]